MRLAALDGAGVAAADAAEENLFERKKGKGRDSIDETFCG